MPLAAGRPRRLGGGRSYAPLLAWEPLLMVVTIAYYRRRTHTTTAPSRTDRSSKIQAAG